MRKIATFGMNNQGINLGMKRIERMRSELRGLVEQHGLLDTRVIRKSQQLDKLIVLYMKRIPRRKASTYPMKAGDGKKMNNIIAKVRSALRKNAEDSLALMEALHKEVEGLAAECYLFDPIVTEKSRELDRIIMKCIRP